MSEILKQTVYLPIEIKPREFEAKVLLSIIAAKRGFRVYLGTKEEINNIVLQKSKKGGVYIYKGGVPMKELRTLKEKVDKFILLDEEMGPAVRDLEEAYEGRVYKGTERLIDAILVIGQVHYEAIKRVRPELVDLVQVTGWPRIDLWKLTGRVEYKNENSIKDFGDFVLFSSDFGIITRQSCQKEVQMLKKASSHSERTEQAYIQEFHASLNDFEQFVKILKKLDQDPSFPALVVRPHPTEAIHIWQEKLKGLKKTKVIYSGDIGPWIFSAKAVIHRGCTSALQAYFLDIPPIYFSFGSSALKNKSLIYYISHVANNLEDLKLLVQQSLDGELNSVVYKDLHRHVKVEEQMASESIVSILSNMKVKPESTHRCKIWYRIRYLLRGWMIELLIALGSWLKNDKLMKKKRKVCGGIHSGQVKKIVNRLMGADQRISINEVRFNVVEIESDRIVES